MARGGTRNDGEGNEPEGGGGPPVDMFTGKPIPPRRRPPRRPAGRPSAARRAAFWLAAALVVAGGFWWRSTSAPGPPTAPTSPQAGQTPQPPQSSASEVAPRQLPRAQIPWGTVGTGWSAALWQDSQGVRAAAGRATLFLVSPDGARYPIGSATPGAVLDVSTDGRRILMAPTSLSAKGTVTVQEWDVAVGVPRAIVMATGTGAEMVSVRYSRLDGDELVLSYLDSTTSHVVIERHDRTGALVRRLAVLGDEVTPLYPRRVATPLGRAPLPGEYDGPLAIPSGASFVVQTSSGDGTGVGLAELDARDGTLVRRLTIPPATTSCSPLSAWTGDSVLVRCQTTPSLAAPTDLWALPFDGGASRRVTTASGAVLDGYVDGWSTSAGTLAAEGVPTGVACPVGALDLIAPDGERTSLQPLLGPGSTTGAPEVVSVVPLSAQDRVVVVLRGVCNQVTSLGRYDVAAGTSSALLGGDLDGGTVLSAVTIGEAG